ncbi:Phosphoribosylglycinamide formyltransferase [compost metagenome]
MHFVDGGMDTGPVIAQRSVAVEAGDTAESLAKRIHQVEYELYPEVVGAFAAGMVELQGRHVIVRQ